MDTPRNLTSQVFIFIFIYERTACYSDCSLGCLWFSVDKDSLPSNKRPEDGNMNQFFDMWKRQASPKGMHVRVHTKSCLITVHVYKLSEMLLVNIVSLDAALVLIKTVSVV